MIKILYIVSTLKRSGTTVQLLNNISYLDKNRYDINLLSLSPEEPDSMADDFCKFKIYNLKLNRLASLIYGKRKLLNLLHSIKPDIVHTQGIRADSYSILINKFYNVISTIHNYPPSDYLKRYGRILGTLMAAYHIQVIKKRSNCIACSKSVSMAFKQFSNIEINFIQNGVNTRIFRPTNNEEKKILRNKLSLPLDKKIFISVGQLIELKDMNSIIRAFTKIADSMLIIAGDGDQMEFLKNLAKENSAIKFVGHVKNIKDYLQASDFFVSSSLSEGLPNTVLEAMACGLPVILSRIDPHLEVFENNEEYQNFFSTKDYLKLGELMKNIINSDYSSLSQIMLNIISSRFTAELMSLKYQEYYNKLAESAEKNK